MVFGSKFQEELSEKTLEPSETLSLSTQPCPRSQSGLLGCPYLVGPDQGLHSQVVLDQFAGLGPVGDCRPALRDDRGELWLSRAR